MMGSAKYKTVRTAEIEISYREFGAPDGLPVLFYHGFPDAFDAGLGRLDAKAVGKFLERVER